MKADIHPKYVDAEIRCACGNVIKTRSTRAPILIGICNVCHPFYTGQQTFVDTAGRVDRCQRRLAKTPAAQAAAAAAATKKQKRSLIGSHPPAAVVWCCGRIFFSSWICVRTLRNSPNVWLKSKL